MNKFMKIVIDKLFNETVKAEEISKIFESLCEEASDFGLTEEQLKKEIDETLKMAQNMDVVTIQGNRVRFAKPDIFLLAASKKASEYGYHARCIREDDSDASVVSDRSLHDMERLARNKRKYRSRSRNRPSKKGRSRRRYY